MTTVPFEICSQQLETERTLRNQLQEVVAGKDAEITMLRSEAIKFAEGVLEVCEFLDNSDSHYTKHTQTHIARLKGLS